jgi:hypothetical protein
MRLHGLAMIRNEADIVESFVRHNLRFLDALTLIVHRPSDGTREILEALAAEGLPLELLPLDELGFYQGQRMTQAARQIFARQKPDFLFALDADEFLRAETRREIEERLAGIPQRHYGTVSWYNYVPDVRDPVNEDEPLRRLRHRHPMDSSASRNFKLVLGQAFAADASLVICHGNHALASTDEKRDRQLGGELHRLGPMLSHFPVRSGEQIINKTVIGWLAHIVIGEHTLKRSEHWRAFYSKIRDRVEIGKDELDAIARGYLEFCVSSDEEKSALENVQLIDDPVAIQFEIRYAGLRRTAPLANLLNYAEQLAHALLSSQQKSRLRSFG